VKAAAEVGMWRRIAALPRAARLYAHAGFARRREARALVAAGDVACDVPELGASAEVALVLEEAAALRARRDAARRAAAASLEADRTDWADAPPGLKLLIVARGLLVRGVLAAQRRRIERELAPLLSGIGASAMASPPVAACLPDDVRTGIERERARAERAAAERGLLLAPFGGRALPPSVSTGARELGRVALGLGGELRSRLVPRLPAVVGLAAGWWIAHAFTSSRWAGFAERLGLRQGGPWVVSGETYERLEFWGPLVAAGLCAYLGSRFWSFLERRYAAGAQGRTAEGARQDPVRRR
jgi:hypothetical protein